MEPMKIAEIREEVKVLQTKLHRVWASLVFHFPNASDQQHKAKDAWYHAGQLDKWLAAIDEKPKYRSTVCPECGAEAEIPF